MTATMLGPLNTYIDLLLDTVCVVDIEGRFVYVSAGCERVFGYTQDEMKGRLITDMLHPDDLDRTLQTAREVMQGKLVPYFENRYIRKDGSVVHIMWSARWSEDEKLRIAVARDITSRVRSEAKQRAMYAISEAAHTTSDLSELFSQIHKIVSGLLPVDSFSIALYDNTDSPGLAANTAGHCRIAYAFPDNLPGDTGMRSTQPSYKADQRVQLAEHIINSQSNLLTHVQSDLAGVVNWLGVPLRTQTHVLGALLASRNNHQHKFSEMDKELLHFVGTQIATAVERQQMLSRLQQMALYDSLTQLPNRSLFEDRVQSALARARRDNATLALLYIDLDRFKEINDTYGHAAGDLLLQQVARRLESCLRECDTVARLGGDEFVVLLENIEGDDHVGKVSDKIRHALVQVFMLDKHRISIHPSMGAAHYPAHGKTLQTLLHHADMQMYAAKRLSAGRE